MKTKSFLRRAGITVAAVALLVLAWVYVPIFFEQINTHILDVAVDKSGNVFVIAQKPKSLAVQKFDSQGRFITEFDGPANTNSQLRSPNNISLDTQDNVYVTDNLDCSLLKFNNDGQFLSKWGSCNQSQPNGLPKITVDGQGNIYKLEEATQRITKFDQNGQPFTEFASAYPIKWAFDMAISSGGDIYISDTGNGRIQQYNKDGQFVRKWGAYGDNNYAQPSRVAVSQQGNVYIADMSSKVFQFTTEGKLILTFGGPGQVNDYHDNPGDGNFISPRGLAVDSQGYIYVTDEFTRRVQKFDSNGKFVGKWEIYTIPGWVAPMACLLILSIIILTFGPFLRRRMKRNR